MFTGIVEEVGPGCTRVKKGDHVVGTWMIPCGHCRQCAKGRGNLCEGTFEYFTAGLMLDGTSRIKDKNGKMVRHGNFVSGFSDHSVVPENGLIPIPKEFPLEHACLMGCAIPTGWGSVVNTAKVQPGDSVVVYGLGGIGLSTLRAAVLSHAYPVIAVDLEAGKESLAKEFGATHFICNQHEDPVKKVHEICGGPADIAFEAIGDPGATVQAYWSVGNAGKVIIVGISPEDAGTTLPLQVTSFQQKSIMGNLYGGISTYVDIPKLVQLATAGDLKLDKLVSNKFKLDDLNDVIDKMDKRQLRGRWVLEWD